MQWADQDPRRTQRNTWWPPELVDYAQPSGVSSHSSTSSRRNLVGPGPTPAQLRFDSDCEYDTNGNVIYQPRMYDDTRMFARPQVHANDVYETGPLRAWPEEQWVEMHADEPPPSAAIERLHSSLMDSRMSMSHA